MIRKPACCCWRSRCWRGRVCASPQAICPMHCSPRSAATCRRTSSTRRRDWCWGISCSAPTSCRRATSLQPIWRDASLRLWKRNAPCGSMRAIFRRPGSSCRTPATSWRRCRRHPAARCSAGRPKTATATPCWRLGVRRRATRCRALSRPVPSTCSDRRRSFRRAASRIVSSAPTRSTPGSNSYVPPWASSRRRCARLSAASTGIASRSIASASPCQRVRP